MSTVKVLKVEFPAPPAALMTPMDTDLPPDAAKVAAMKALIQAASEYVRANAVEATVEKGKK